MSNYMKNEFFPDSSDFRNIQRSGTGRQKNCYSNNRHYLFWLHSCRIFGGISKESSYKNRTEFLR